MGWEDVYVNEQLTRVNQISQRIEQLDNFQPGGVHDHIVSNDGLNADYVRINGQVIVDNNQPNPYGG